MDWCFARLVLLAIGASRGLALVVDTHHHNIVGGVIQNRAKLQCNSPAYPQQESFQQGKTLAPELILHFYFSETPIF
jgi:hypothetical protein